MYGLADRASNPHLIAPTARWMAAARARESERTDRLFDDPLAETLAGPEGFEWLERMNLTAGWAGPELYPVIRTRFFDEFLLDACTNGGCRQVVIVAAGLDTRAFRLDWPADTRLYELDLPEVLEPKQAVVNELGVQPRCEQRLICTDLGRDPWHKALRAAGYRSGEPSVWLIEGLLFYLPGPAVGRLLDRVGAQMTSGSLLGLDLMNCDLFLSPLTWRQRFALTSQGAPGLFGTNDPGALLKRHGWDANVIQPGEDGASFGRWPKPLLPKWLPGVPRSFLVRARHI